MSKPSKRNLRLRAWRSDVNAVGAGLAGLAFAVSLPAILPPQGRLHAAGIMGAALAGLFGVGLLLRGLFYPIPLVDVEEPWNTAYDLLRNETQKISDDLLLRHYVNLRNRHRNAPDTWRECALLVPIPRVDERPLHKWAEWLTNHKDERVRIFFEFATWCEREQAGNNYRRLAVRTYDVFRRSISTKPGFREWMEQTEVRAGAEEIVVLLAYMEVARAREHPVGRTPTHPGFWTLAEEWHPNMVSLPKKVGQNELDT